MGLFKKGNATTLTLKGVVSESKYPDYAGGEGSSNFPSIANQVTEKVLEGYNQKVNYINGNPFRADASKNDGTNGNTGNAGQPTKTSVPSSDNGWAIDIAQSHHFTVEIRDASGHKSSSGNLLNYKTPNNVYSSFLPVKNMSLSYSGYENLNIPLSIFGDFQLLQRKRVETITLTCYDEDTSFLERNLQVWNEECFPQGKYVAYMDDVVKELIYRGYTVDGRESLNVRRFVIPTGQVVVNRDYSENEAKFITFSLACVGDGSVCATGVPSVLVDIPIESSKPPQQQENNGNENNNDKKKESTPLEVRPYDHNGVTYQRIPESKVQTRPYDNNSVTYNNFVSSPAQGGGSLTYDNRMP